jgi:uncharacterized protein (DUF2147 family)
MIHRLSVLRDDLAVSSGTGTAASSQGDACIRWIRGMCRLALGLLLSAGLAGAAHASDPTGQWWAEGGYAKVEIRTCGDALCGQVVWLRHPLDADGCELRDVENPDAELRGRAVEGLEILRDLRASSDVPNEWNGGTVYDPGSGRTYSAVAEMDGADRLRVRGYFGIRLLGRTTTWVRVGSENQCIERD